MACDVQRYGSAGQVVPNIEVKIIDDNGNHVGPNERGEICYKSSVLFSGYFEDPEETNAAIKDGWVLSEDVGYFDDDGFLFVIDRKKDMITYNGVHVSFARQVCAGKSLIICSFGHRSLKLS